MAPAHASSRAPVADHFTDRASEYGSASSSGLWKAWRAMERRAIWRLLRPTAGERILDAGCGAGYYSEHLIASGAEVCATDLSASMTRETARRLHVPAFVSNLEHIPLTGKFDAVLCAGALEFCNDPVAAMIAMAALVAPQGRLVIMLPADGIGGKIYRCYHMRNGLAIKLFSAAWLREIATTIGMKLTETASAGFNHVARFVPALHD